MFLLSPQWFSCLMALFKLDVFLSQSPPKKHKGNVEFIYNAVGLRSLMEVQNKQTEGRLKRAEERRKLEVFLHSPGSASF